MQKNYIKCWYWWKISGYRISSFLLTYLKHSPQLDYVEISHFTFIQSSFMAESTQEWHGIYAHSIHSLYPNSIFFGSSCYQLKIFNKCLELPKKGNSLVSSVTWYASSVIQLFNIQMRGKWYLLLGLSYALYHTNVHSILDLKCSQRGRRSPNDCFLLFPSVEKIPKEWRMRMTL